MFVTSKLPRFTRMNGAGLAPSIGAAARDLVPRAAAIGNAAAPASAVRRVNLGKCVMTGFSVSVRSRYGSAVPSNPFKGVFGHGSLLREIEMSDLKTTQTDVDPARWIAGVEPERRRIEAQDLDALFQQVTGWQPRMWGTSIVGYGAYDYTYASGRSGRWMATGFSPRKAQLSIYIMPGYAEFGEILDRLGPHKLGKSCLYITRLERVDLDVLADLIRAELEDLRQRWPVFPT